MSVLQKSLFSFREIGANRAEALKKDLNVETYADLLYFFPFRYEDRQKVYKLKEIRIGLPEIQCKGLLGAFQELHYKSKKVLMAPFTDASGTIRLVWLNGLGWIRKKIVPNTHYMLFAKPSYYKKRLTFIHPELTFLKDPQDSSYLPKLTPVYKTTAKLTRLGLHSKGLAKLQKQLLSKYADQIVENLPDVSIQKYGLLDRASACRHMHVPKDSAILRQAQYRFKFEEVFYLQLRMTEDAPTPDRLSKQFTSQTLLRAFFYDHLSFSLTNAQKKVIKEIYADFSRGKQMHRLLQGDVGSGKTIVAFLSMLVPLAHGAQVAFIAPTQILAMQHYATISAYAQKLSLEVGLLTSNIKGKERKQLKEDLQSGKLPILIGTHAVLEEQVQFQDLGLVVIDEQHRFGVAQRAQAWDKQTGYLPHILIMTATPIPRTLTMTFYRHLSLSTIDELPPDRKLVKTYHLYERSRLRVFGFIRKQIETGNQVYIVYPRIDASDAAKDLIDGYESICRAFPNVAIGILHGRMKAEAKNYEMNRFAKGETKIMMATTIIEVGINVPNANTIVIENAEMFGLAQLHQLRGRVARSNAQAYCILLTKNDISPLSERRIRKIIETSDGFAIAECDLALRGPGHLDGVQQSGSFSFRMVDIAQDKSIMQAASDAAYALRDIDPTLSDMAHKSIYLHLRSLKQQQTWRSIG